jgi:uncharacterized membrane protein YczE
VQRPRSTSPLVGRVVQLVASCAVLGLGVGLVLTAGLGSDGYSSLINGFALSTGASYWAVNWLIGSMGVAFAWSRAVRPGLGTLCHPLVVGVTVNLVLDATSAPTSAVARVLLLLLGTFVLAAGVAAYLEAGFGAGPFESVALAMRPIPFRIAYIVLQAAGAVAGWTLGASIGVGTLIIVIGVGPLASTLQRRFAYLRCCGRVP